MPAIPGKERGFELADTTQVRKQILEKLQYKAQRAGNPGGAGWTAGNQPPLPALRGRKPAPDRPPVAIRPAPSTKLGYRPRHSSRFVCGKCDLNAARVDVGPST